MKIRNILLCAVVALLVAVPAAFAGTTETIINDARDGRIDGTYTQAQLQAALASPLLKTYGGDGGVEAVKSAIGSQSQGGTGGNLPFTGAEMVTFALIGGVLIVAGFVLRRSGREERDALEV